MKKEHDPDADLSKTDDLVKICGYEVPCRIDSFDNNGNFIVRVPFGYHHDEAPEEDELIPVPAIEKIIVHGMTLEDIREEHSRIRDLMRR